MSDILDTMRDAHIEVLRELGRLKGSKGRFEQIKDLKTMDEGLTEMIRHYKFDGWDKPIEVEERKEEELAEIAVEPSVLKRLEKEVESNENTISQ